MLGHFSNVINYFSLIRYYLLQNLIDCKKMRPFDDISRILPLVYNFISYSILNSLFTFHSSNFHCLWRLHYLDYDGFSNEFVNFSFGTINIVVNCLRTLQLSYQKKKSIRINHSIQTYLSHLQLLYNDVGWSTMKQKKCLHS